MNLLPGVQERLDEHRHAATTAAKHAIAPARLDLPLVASSILTPRDASEAQALVAELHSTPVAAVAIDSEYGFDGHALELRNGKTWQDVRGQRPVCVSIAAWLTSEDGDLHDVIYRAVLDVRMPGIVEALAEILRIRAPLVAHHAKAELFTFWSLGLDPEIPQLFDTCVAAKCLDLGLGHRRSRPSSRDASPFQRVRDEAEHDARVTHGYSLLGLCERYRATHPFSLAKDQLRERFLRLHEGEPLDDLLIEYAAADAEATLRVYAAQQTDIVRAGLGTHLHEIEFPFTLANARIEWNGVSVDRARLDLVRRASEGASRHYDTVLAGLGIDTPGSVQQFRAVMARAGLESHFFVDGAFSTEDSVLDANEDIHPAVRALRMHRRYSRLAHEEWLTGALTGADGRVHPIHNQLGAATGRNTCSTPNIAGIGKVLRPVVVAPAGRALVEFDYSQIEIGVAAAEHDDRELIEAFNSGDVYAAMAQRFFASDLDDAERAAVPRDFKRMRPELRDRMKVFVLAVIYNIQAPALAARFDVTTAEAERERQRFLDQYPTLQRRMEESAVYGKARGYASMASGLRRLVEGKQASTAWTRNFLRNTPVQGGAALVFKRAIVDLDREFRGERTLLVLPIHDAVLIECDAIELDAVCTRVTQVMERAMRVFYPALEPRVEVNRSHPHCWNKDGVAHSIERFLDDPTFRVEDAKRAQSDYRAQLSRDPASWEGEAREAFEERAAIIEFDGGFTREWAELLAAIAVRGAAATDAVAEGGVE